MVYLISSLQLSQDVSLYSCTFPSALSWRAGAQAWNLFRTTCYLLLNIIYSHHPLSHLPKYPRTVWHISWPAAAFLQHLHHVQTTQTQGTITLVIETSTACFVAFSQPQLQTQPRYYLQANDALQDLRASSSLFSIYRHTRVRKRLECFLSAWERVSHCRSSLHLLNCLQTACGEGRAGHEVLTEVAPLQTLYTCCE